MIKMKRVINNFLNQYKEVYDDKLYYDVRMGIKSNGDLNQYYEKIKNCLNCSLGHKRNNFVFGVGNPNAEIVFVGEAPGKNEDLKGEPFVGRGGKLLDKILEAIKLSRKEVYILNVLKCRDSRALRGSWCS